MQAEDMVFTKKYKEIREPKILTDMTVEFTPVATGKSKPKIAPKTQKSRRNAETPVMVSNQPSSVILDTVWGDQRESDPRQESHNLLCYHYTMATMSLIIFI